MRGMRSREAEVRSTLIAQYVERYVTLSFKDSWFGMSKEHLETCSRRCCNNETTANWVAA